MRQFKDIDELAMSMDIITRLALVTAAKTFDKKEDTDQVLDAIEIGLAEAYGQEKPKELIAIYKTAITEMQEKFKDE